jgi:hypothetical protein
MKPEGRRGRDVPVIRVNNYYHRFMYSYYKP